MATEAEKRIVVEMWEAQSGFAKIIDRTGLDIDTIVAILNDKIFESSAVSTAAKIGRHLREQKTRRARRKRKGSKP